MWRNRQNISPCRLKACTRDMRYEACLFSHLVCAYNHDNISISWTYKQSWSVKRNKCYITSNESRKISDRLSVTTVKLKKRGYYSGNNPAPTLDTGNVRVKTLANHDKIKRGILVYYNSNWILCCWTRFLIDYLYRMYLYGQLIDVKNMIWEIQSYNNIE
jgi:hypothetical protein